MKPVTMLTLVVVTLISFLHVLRLILRVEATVAGAEVPLWASIPAAVFFGGLAIGIWREHLFSRPPAV